MSARRYRFGPLEQRAVVGPLRVGQVLIVASGAVLGLASLYALRSVVGLVVGVLALCLAVAAVCVPIEGRTPEEWAPVLGRWLHRRKRAEARLPIERPDGRLATGRGGRGRARSLAAARALGPEIALGPLRLR